MNLNLSVPGTADIINIIAAAAVFIIIVFLGRQISLKAHKNLTEFLKGHGMLSDNNKKSASNIKHYFAWSFYIAGAMFFISQTGLAKNVSISSGSMIITLETIVSSMGLMLIFFILSELVPKLISMAAYFIINHIAKKNIQNIIYRNLETLLKYVVVLIGGGAFIISLGVDPMATVSAMGAKASLYSIVSGAVVLFTAYGFNKLLLSPVMKQTFRYIKNFIRDILSDAPDSSKKTAEALSLSDHTRVRMENVTKYFIYLYGTKKAIETVFIKDMFIISVSKNIISFFTIAAGAIFLTILIPYIINIMIIKRKESQALVSGLKGITNYLNYSILIAGFLIALDAVGVDIDRPLASFGSASITIWSIITFFIIIILTVITTKIFISIMKEGVLNTENIENHASMAIERLIKYTFFLIGLAIALSTLGFDIFAVATGLGLVGFAIAFGMQDAIANLVAGVMLAVEKPIAVGDRIKVGETWGDVTDIGLRSTKIRTTKNELVIIPNKDMASKELWNFTKGDRTLAVDIPIGISYESDWKLGKKIMLETALAHPLTIRPEDAAVIMTGFGASSLDFILWVWISEAKKRFTFRSDILEAVKDRFDEYGIEIPYKQITVHMASKNSSGEKGHD